MVRAGSAPGGTAQQSDSEDTVTISKAECDSDTETDGEFVPAERVRLLCHPYLMALAGTA